MESQITQEEIEQRKMDEKYMREAIRQAKKAYALEEVPIGCVIVYEGKIIGRGYNRRTIDKNALAHAEVQAIRKACKKMDDWRLEDCTLYVTCLLYTSTGNRMKNIKKALDMELREHKSSFIVYFVLRILVIVTMILQFLNGNYENFFLCILTLILLIMPSLIQVTLKIELPTVLEILILIFIFSAEILGEIREYYIMIPMWDTILHTINGFLAAAIGFSMVDLLNRSDRMTFQLSPLFTAIVAFCFSMTIGVVWEFFEFGMDMIFGLDMQKDTVIQAIRSVTLNPDGRNIVSVIDPIRSVVINGKELGIGGYLDIGLIDTMKDLIVNFIGAVVFSVFGYVYVKNRGKGNIVARFVPQRKKQDRDFLRIVGEKDKKKEEKQE